jgi:DNA end-binding protein Ku
VPLSGEVRTPAATASTAGKRNAARDEEAGVPRSIWKGSLSFGLVNVPIALYPATSDKTLHFHQVEDGTSDRIRYKKVNERTGKEVSSERIVKAMDMGGGEYVIVSDEELAEAEPEKSRTIDIKGFVDLADIDPIYFRNSYYLAPQNDAATKAYQLLREAMETAGKIGVASFVLRNKEYLVAIRPEPDVLALETLYFSDEIRNPAAELPHLSDNANVTPKQRSMAQSLIESLAEKWNPADYHDSYREHVQALLKEKQAGHDSIAHTEPDRGGKVIDLLEALQASVKRQGETTNSGQSVGGKSAGPKKAAAAKRTAAKKATTPRTAKKASPTKKSSTKKSPKAATSSRPAKKTAPRRKAS